MSAQSAPKTAESIDTAHKRGSRTPPEDVFRDHIERNNAICSRCFTRQRTLKLAAVPVRTEETNGEHLSMTKVADAETGDEQVLMESWEATDSIELVYPPRISKSMGSMLDDVPLSWMRACPNPTVYCTECGAIDDDGSRSTLSKARLLEYAREVSERLHEMDVEHDRGLLVAVAKQLKRRDAVQAKDDLILAHATRSAVEKSRYGRARQMEIDTNDGDIEVADASDIGWMQTH